MKFRNLPLCESQFKVLGELMPKNWKSKLEPLQKRLAIEFKNPLLLQAAVTHSSVLNGPAEARIVNRTYETLGDSVLGTAAVYHAFQAPGVDIEGQMSLKKTMKVNNERLNAVAEAWRLSDVVLHRVRPEGLDTVYAGAVEAIIGAYFVDRGLQPSIELALNHVVHHDVTIDFEDPVSNMQIRCLDAKLGIPDYRKSIQKNGMKKVTVFCKNVEYGHGAGTNFTMAKRLAAARALAKHF